MTTKAKTTTEQGHHYYPAGQGPVGERRHRHAHHHNATQTRDAVTKDKKRLVRATDHVDAAGIELSGLYTSANFGHDDIVEIREIYATLTNVANRLRELAKRTKT